MNRDYLDFLIKYNDIVNNYANYIKRLSALLSKIFNILGKYKHNPEINELLNDVYNEILLIRYFTDKNKEEFKEILKELKSIQ